MMDTEEKYKVVIIDDERSASDALRRELEPYREFEIKGIASSGAKGKKMIMELHPDLLFLDVELPDILGLNLLSEIKDDVLWDMKVVCSIRPMINICFRLCVSRLLISC